MRALLMAATGLLISASTATAGGLDRSYTPIDILFERGNYAELSYGIIMPDVSGADFLGNASGNIADGYGLFAAGFKGQISEKLSFSIYADQPYGTDTRYVGSPVISLLGGTSANAESTAVTALLKYRITERISIYGGPRVLTAEGNITLSGLAYGPVNGYNVNFSSNTGTGYVAGAAYEIPEIALRVSGTYHSDVSLNMRTQENFPATAAPLLPVGFPIGVPVATGVSRVTVPQSFELAAQSGVNENTLVFGSIRWSDWEAFSLIPTALSSDLAQLDSVTTYEIGIGRRFSEKFSGSLAISYEPGGSDSLVSPLDPTDGQTAVTIGGKYQASEKVSLSGGIRYTMLGNAFPETGTPDTPRGIFRNNDAVSVGIKIGINLN